MRKRKIEVSIIVPAFREENVIEKTLLSIKGVLETITPNFEIICVVDGVTDATLETAKKLSRKYPSLITVVGYDKNRGKGFALRTGFSLAKGDLIGFVDADGQIKSEGLIEALEKLITTRADIVIGSKRHKNSKISYSIYRKLVTSLSQIFIKLLFNIGVRDTQAGLKCFTKEVIKSVYPRLMVDRFAVDIELLAVASRLGFKKIIEIPIEVREPQIESGVVDEKISLDDLSRSLWDTLQIFYRLRVERYYDNENKTLWKKTKMPKLV